MFGNHTSYKMYQIDSKQVSAQAMNIKMSLNGYIFSLPVLRIHIAYYISHRYRTMNILDYVGTSAKYKVHAAPFVQDSS